jgi:hypothetical protein
VACSSSFILRSRCRAAWNPFAFKGVEISLNEKRLGLVAQGGVLRAAFHAVNAKSTTLPHGLRLSKGCGLDATPILIHSSGLYKKSSAQ